MVSPSPGPEPLYRNIARVVVTREEIDRRVRELGQAIAAAPTEELTIIAVLTGALIFLADLIRRIPLPLRIEVVSIRSYPGTATRSQGPQLLSDLPLDLAGRDVLLLDDILDSGRTLDRLRGEIEALRPRSLRTCVLLRKDRPDLPDRTEADFVGFDVPDEFLVGYGLDYDNCYRNLPEICVLREHAGQECGAGGQAGEGGS